MLDVIFRGLGGLLVASVVGQFAAHAGMPAWQIGLMVFFVAIGLPMCLSGRPDGYPRRALTVHSDSAISPDSQLMFERKLDLCVASRRTLLMRQHVYI